jgi:hypothetical protein
VLFRSNSSNAYTITANGTPSVQRFNPFGTTTAYSTSVIGGSGYFDGSGDYLNLTGTALGTDIFTYEAWVYLTVLTGYQTIHDSRPSGGSSAGFTLQVNPSGTVEAYSGGTMAVTTATLSINQWYHIAFVRNTGNSCAIYINGVSSGTGSNSNNLTSTSISIGKTFDNYYFNGYISNSRIVKGTAVYTSAFTPPTAPLTAISGTQLLLLTTNAGIFDNAMMNNLETVGNAQISTSVKKYGTGSMTFNGTTDYLVTYKALNLQMGGGNFTIECWIYPTSRTGWRGIFSKGNINQFEYSLGWEDSVLTARLNDNGSFTVTDTVNLNAWNHVAYVRNGTAFTVYINGVSRGSTTSSTSFITTQSNEPFLVGYYDFISNYAYYVGYIDDLRITKGYARYTANFTPPTAAFPNIGPY